MPPGFSYACCFRTSFVLKFLTSVQFEVFVVPLQFLPAQLGLIFFWELSLQLILLVRYCIFVWICKIQQLIRDKRRLQLLRAQRGCILCSLLFSSPLDKWSQFCFFYYLFCRPCCIVWSLSKMVQLCTIMVPMVCKLLPQYRRQLICNHTW